MHSYYVNLLFEILAKLGISKKQLLETSGLAHLDIDDSIDLETEQLDALFTAALELSGEPQLGIHLGAKINMVPKGILGYALLTSPTITDALKLLVSYHRAIFPSLEIELVENEQASTLVAKAPNLSPALENFYSEVFFAAIMNNENILIGEEALENQAETATRLELNYPQPNNTQIYADIFGPQLKFKCQQNALIFTTDTLSAPVNVATDLAQEAFKRECERLLPQNKQPTLVSEQVKRLLIEIRLNFPTCANVAKKLHMSESTLRRHLKSEGLRFQELLDQVRSKLAHEYLLTTRLPVSEIASLLGFSDSANFRRSFKRWSNKTPSEIRKSNLDVDKH